jgi:hypothetical protein
MNTVTWSPRRRMSFQRLEPKLNCSIGPMWILLLDQRNLPLAFPSLELLFSGDRRFHRSCHLEMDEPHDAVPAREAAHHLVAVLPDTSREVGCNTDVKRAVTATGEDINARLSIHGRRMPCSWMLNQVTNVILTKVRIHEHQGSWLAARMTLHLPNLPPPCSWMLNQVQHDELVG